MVKGKMEEKTDWRGQSESQIGEEKKMAALLVLPRPAKSLQIDAGFSRKT